MFDCKLVFVEKSCGINYKNLYLSFETYLKQMHLMKEKKLIEEAQKGDKAALAKLVKEHENTVYNFAFKICRNPDSAENIMQETFLSMVKSLHQFDGNSKLTTWLYRIVSNHCLMAYRKKKNQFLSFDEEESGIENKATNDWSHIPTIAVENKELKNILDNAISKLSPDYRIVFILRDVNGYSTEETGNITNLSVAAVKSRLHRARAFLRDEINKAFKK